MNKSLKKKKIFELAGQSVDILSKIGVFLLALFLTSTRFIFGTYPFGFAILAGGRRETPFAFVGCIASVLLFMNANIVYLVAFIALFALRIAGSAWLGETKTKKSLGKESKNTIFESFFYENVTVRVALASLCVFVIGVLDVIANGYNYFYIFVLVFSTVLVGILTLAISGLFRKERDQQFFVGVCALFLMIVLALSKKELFGLDVSIILTYSLVIYTSRFLGGASASALGALLGLCHSYEFSLCFAIMGIVSSLFWNFSYYFGIMCGALISVGYGIFVSGYEAIVYLLPEAVLSSLVMYSLLRFELLPRISRATNTVVPDAPRLALLEEKEMRFAKTTSISDSLLALSELSQESGIRAKRLSLEECRSLCLETTEENCFSCPKKSICWERDISVTEDNISSLSDGIFAKNEVGYDDISEKFLHRCPNVDRIIASLNDSKRSFTEKSSRGDKLELCREGYDSMAKLISALNDDECDNSAITEKAERCIKKLGLRFDKIEIVGKREKTIIITGASVEGSKCSDVELKNELERALSMSLTQPYLESINKSDVIRLYTRERLDALEGFLSSPLDKNMPNGDTYSSIRTKNGKFYAILCDGMGSGESAKSTSSLCVSFLSRLLASSPRADVAISMLNTFIRAKGTECSSSVDIAEIDLYNGECSFIKSGACASFVKREDKVFCLSSKTAPIGILKTPDAEKLSLSLLPDDIIVMLSDGILSDDDYSSITEAISNHRGTENELCKKLISLSNAKDDKTAIVLKIKEKCE